MKHSRGNQKFKSFSRQGAKIWNLIPQELRKLSKYVFKKSIQNQLLQDLKEEGFLAYPLHHLWRARGLFRHGT